MPKQPQTISFELAEKLNKYNLNFELYFWWSTLGDNITPILLDYAEYYDRKLIKGHRVLYPAYQLHEILEMLPKKIPYRHPGYIAELECEVSENLYWWSYDNTSPMFSHKNPAEAAGNLLLWCIENGYVKV